MIVLQFYFLKLVSNEVCNIFLTQIWLSNAINNYIGLKIRVVYVGIFLTLNAC